MNATTLIQGPVIEVMITLDANQEPKVTYLQDGEVCSGSVVVTCGEDITYRLVNSTGYAFMGAGFLTPYDNIIDSVQVSADGQELILVDEDNVQGTTKFQLIFTNSTNSLLLLSPDPQVINKENVPPKY
ncbi:DP-EP family protein [Rheinheimera sediminis]|uniref:DP-EP family protein n=1 Tax=Rheinheimera sp. YQF-1 TaxID=2499626 RepID=UPI000FDAED80|nr:DP-EP family protein [Rheinheimera sp. YQF-1]RVT47958.1 DP-EP family protein [Rheinheimera sp. YQF-1]